MSLNSKILYCACL